MEGELTNGVQIYSIVPEDVYDGRKSRKRAGGRTEEVAVADALMPLWQVFDVEAEEGVEVVLLHLPAWSRDGHGVVATAECSGVADRKSVV